MKTFIIALLLLICDSSLKAQGVPYNQEFKVNTLGGNIKEDYPSVSNLVDGGYVVCWRGWLNINNGQDINGQCFNVDGSKRGSEFLVNNTTDSHQDVPNVCGLADGGFVICWESDSQDGSKFGVYGQIFDFDGSKRGSEFQVNTYINDEQTDPSLTSLSDGGFAVCWTSFYQDSSAHGIFGQCFESDGSKRGSEFQANTYTTHGQWSPSIASLADGKFVICWQSWEQDDDEWGVFGQIFNSDRTKLSSEFHVNTYTDRGQLYPSISSLVDGGFVICWESWRQDGSNGGIYSQCFNGDGSKHGYEFRVNTYTDETQGRPSVSKLLDTGFVVCWISYSHDDGKSGVYGKYFINEINHKLEHFSLLEPTFDSILNTTTSSFSWQNSSILCVNFPWELEYHLYLDDNENFNSPLIIPTGFDTLKTIGSLSTGTSYFWKVLAKNVEGDSMWSSETFGFFVDWNATVLEDVSTIQPKEFKLYQNYPNPFNPETVIKYTLPADQSVYNVKLRIYNSLGQLIEVLLDAKQNPGLYAIKWNTNNVPSGVYFCRIEVGNFQQLKKCYW